MAARHVRPRRSPGSSLWSLHLEDPVDQWPPELAQPTPEGLQVWDPPDGQWSHPPAFGDGAAGLVSTVDDLLAFARMFLADGKPALSEAAGVQMTSDQLTAAQRAGTGEAFLHGHSWSLCQSVITEGPRSGAFGRDGASARPGWSTRPETWP